MKLLEQYIPAKEVVDMIAARLEAVTNQYRYAVANDRTIEAEALAETKWQIAELKMQLCDRLIELAAEEGEGCLPRLK